ncbi:MAG: hypothetical protein IJC39_00740 [Firmicutes bacterium]|nr:hypothetical protein [Bacillota bacterium]
MFGFFDFNKDGKVDFMEEIFGIGLLHSIFAEDTQEAYAEELSYEDYERKWKIEEIEDRIETLQQEIAELEAALDKMYYSKPHRESFDDYSRWRTRMDAMEKRIRELETALDEALDELAV